MHTPLRTTGWRATAVTAVALLSLSCAPPDPGPGAGGDTGAPNLAGQESRALMENLSRTLRVLGDKMVALARAMPEDAYAWQPTEGVRSVGQVYAHAAADNYFVPALLGAEVPEETGVTQDGATVGAYEERMAPRPKEEIVQGLEASFVLLRATMEASLDHADRMVELRGNPLTTGDLWVRAITHLHEHLGQSIAYARMNGVVPPWSR